MLRSQQRIQQQQTTDISSKGIEESIILLLFTLLQFNSVTAPLMIVIIHNSCNTIRRTPVEYEFNLILIFIHTVFFISNHQSGKGIQTVLFTIEYNVYSFVFQLILGHILQQDLNLGQVIEFVIDIDDSNDDCKLCNSQRERSTLRNSLDVSLKHVENTF